MKRLLLLLLCGLTAWSAAACSVPSEAPPADTPPVKVAMIIADKLGDKSFNDSAFSGLEQARKDFGIETKLFECNYDSTSYSENMVAAADYSPIVVVVGFEFADLLKVVAKSYPDHTFLNIDNEMPGENITSIIYRQDEGSFLAGAMAALMTTDTTLPRINDKPVIGMVGGVDLPVIRNFQTGYVQGAKYVNPDIEVLTVFSGDFQHTGKCREKASELYDQGADIVFAVAGAAGLGVFEAAEAHEAYAIGVDSDQRYLNPEVILSSMEKRVGHSIYESVRLILQKQLKRGTTYVYGLKEDGVGLSYGDPSMPLTVPDAVKQKVEAIRQEIVSGNIVVQ